MVWNMSDRVIDALDILSKIVQGHRQSTESSLKEAECL